MMLRLIIILLVQLAITASIPATYQQVNLFEIGKFQYSSPYYFSYSSSKNVGSGTVYWNSIGNINYNTSVNASRLMAPAIGISGIFLNPINQMYFDFNLVSYNQNGFSYQIASYYYSSQTFLQYNYLVMLVDFSYMYTTWITFTSSNGFILNPSVNSTEFIFDMSIKLNQTVSLSGFQVQNYLSSIYIQDLNRTNHTLLAPYSNPFEINIVSNMINSTFMKVVLSISTNSLTVHWVDYSFILINSLGLSSNSTYKYLQFRDSSIPYISATNTSNNINILSNLLSVFYGISSFDSKNTTNNIQIKRNSVSSIDLILQVLYGSQNTITINYLSASEAQCFNASFPLYCPSQRSCLSVCDPFRYFQQDNLCKQCHKSCYTCSNMSNKCLTCSISDNRLKVGQLCKPIDFYGESGSSVAELCNSRIPNCLRCTYISQCNQCVNSTYLSVYFKCEADCGNNFFNNNNTWTCKACDPSCLDCFNSSATSCLSCPFQSFWITPGTCSKCQILIPGCIQCLSRYVCKQCSNTTYMNQENNKCYSDCPQRLYNFDNLNGTRICVRCLNPLCYDCVDNTTACTNCSETLDFRRLMTNSCDPIIGYYESGSQIAYKCKKQCSSCDNMTFCTKCVNGYYLSSSNICQSCLIGCQACLNGNSCINCSQSYVLTSSNVCQCFIDNCFYCISIAQGCISCSIGFELSGSRCKPICGDGILIVGIQQCDYKNVYGCSSDCKVMENFNCTSYFNGIVNVSKCVQNNLATLLSVIRIQKSINKNQANIVLLATPNHNEFKYFNIQDIIKLQPTMVFTATYHQITGQIIINIPYNSSIQGIIITTRIQWPMNSSLSISPISTINFLMEDQNNLQFNYYSSELYGISNTISLISLSIIVLGWGVMLLSIFINKLVGLQMMGAIQLCFWGIISFKKLTPTLSGLLTLKYSNFYNIFATNQLPIYNQYPNKIRALLSYLQFCLNCNVSLLLFIIPLLVGLFIFFLRKCFLKYNKYDLLKIAIRKAIGEYAFTGLMLTSYLIWVSAAVELKYTLPIIKGTLSYISLLMCILVIVAYCAYFILLIKKPQWFNQYTNFDKTFIVSNYYYNVLMIERCLVGMLLVYFISFKMVILMPILSSVLQLIYVIIKKPYIENNNKRVIVNLSISLIVLISYLVIEILNDYGTLSMIIPILVCVGLLICIIFNGAFLIMEYKMKKKGQFQKYLSQISQQQALKEQKINNFKKQEQIMVQTSKKEQIMVQPSKKEQIIASPLKLLEKQDKQKVQIKTQMTSKKFLSDYKYKKFMKLSTHVQKKQYQVYLDQYDEI